MKKILSYAKEHMFQTFGKIIFAGAAFIVMNSFLTVHWDYISGFLLFITLTLFVVINACLEGYFVSEGEDIPALVVGTLLFIGATILYCHGQFNSDFAENPLRAINFCYFTLLVNILFSFAELIIEKCKLFLYKKRGIVRQ